MKLAVKDAKRKASIIAETAGVTLVEITNISYSTSPRFFTPGAPQFKERAMIMEASADFKSDSFSQVNLQEIEMSDQVAIQWKIK